MRFFKRNIVIITICIFTFLLVVFSNSNFYAVKNGLKLWANNVIPALFPFLVSVELLKHTNIILILSKMCDKYMKPLFNLPGITAFPLIMGLLSGYPVGAKIVSDIYSQNACTKEEAERMLPLTNNSGPLFIIGTVGIAFFGSTQIGIVLLFTHILASITSGIILGIISRKCSHCSYKYSHYNFDLKNNITIKELGTILSNSITSSIKTILLIGGFVTLFSVVISIIENAHIFTLFSNITESLFGIDSDLVSSCISGIIEFTNGLNKISTIHIKDISILIVVSSFIIGFGGISVLMQVLGIVSKHSLSIRKYFFGKLLQAVFAVIYTTLILTLPMFNLNL